MRKEVSSKRPRPTLGEISARLDQVINSLMGLSRDDLPPDDERIFHGLVGKIERLDKRLDSIFSSKGRKGGFTVIESLLVLTIITIAALLTLANLVSLKQQKQAVVSVSQQVQIIQI